MIADTRHDACTFEWGTKPYKTVLAPVELCGILTELRDNRGLSDENSVSI
ncbi:MAG: hypothetical protein NC252_01340 [Roseburia sp.]|nr:hypothetical protein [Roseburia sp.]MCM1419822.1 hypothetical protein [Bacteroides sp.]